MRRLTGLPAVLASLVALSLALPAGAEGRAVTAASAAEAGDRGVEMAEYMRQVLGQTREPARVADLLAAQDARFLAHQSVTVSYAWLDGHMTPVAVSTLTVGPDLVQHESAESLLPAGTGAAEVAAGRKTDFRLQQWLYEWRNPDGTYTEQNVTNGYWSAPEYRWMDNPDDVIDVRWVVGDLAYVAAYPYDGVRFDQQVHGVASFTVDDQVPSWDVFVNFTPTGPEVYGRVTNVFTNYHHTWLGWRLTIVLGAGSAGTTGSVTLQTDARTWTKGTGLAIRIGSEESSGPAVSDRSGPAGSQPAAGIGSLSPPLPR